MSYETISRIIFKLKSLNYTDFEINYYLSKGLNIIIELFPNILR